MPDGVCASFEGKPLGEMQHIIPQFTKKALVVYAFVVSGRCGHTTHNNPRRFPVRRQECCGGISRKNHIVQFLYALGAVYFHAEGPVGIPQCFPLALCPDTVHVAHMTGHMRVDYVLHIIVRRRCHDNTPLQGYRRAIADSEVDLIDGFVNHDRKNARRNPGAGELSVTQRRNAGQDLAFQKLQHGAAARRDMAHKLFVPRLRDCCY